MCSQGFNNFEDNIPQIFQNIKKWSNPEKLRTTVFTIKHPGSKRTLVFYDQTIFFIIASFISDCQKKLQSPNTKIQNIKYDMYIEEHIMKLSYRNTGTNPSLTRVQNLKIALNKKTFQTLSLASLSMENSIPSRWMIILVWTYSWRKYLWRDKTILQIKESTKISRIAQQLSVRGQAQVKIPIIYPFFIPSLI